MTAIRAVRGAIQVERDDPGIIFTGTCSMVLEVIRRNHIVVDDVISVFLTMTPDLRPAAIEHVYLRGAVQLRPDLLARQRTGTTNQ